jgi:NAD(P)-dependent dehydrogenase (short-subunit alcohol dehydrogenase family)
MYSCMPTISRLDRPMRRRIATGFHSSALRRGNSRISAPTFNRGLRSASEHGEISGGPNVPTWEYPVEDWLQVLDIDLNGVFYCCRAVVPIMRSAGYGRVVNIASVAGKEGNPNAPAYSAAKAGVIGLTKSLGKELAETDIRVNCVTPAVAKTRIFDQMTEEHIGYMLSKIPMGRFVEVEEIAALVAWLSSEECSFSTGAVFDITGGRSTY